MGGRSMKDVGGAVLAGSSPPFLGRERAAVDVDVGPERRSPRYHWWVFTDDVYLLRRRLDSVHFFFSSFANLYMSCHLERVV